MGDTKIFISPFGAGEWSMKDEEIVLSGAVLMKPAAGILDAGVPMYEPNVTCIDVRPDWVGLEEILVASLGNIPLLQEIQAKSHAVVGRFRSLERAIEQPEFITKYEALIKKALTMP